MSKSRRTEIVALGLVLAFIFATLFGSVNVLAFAADEVSLETCNGKGEQNLQTSLNMGTGLPVVNSSFEDGLVGWRYIYGETGAFISDEIKLAMNYSLCLENNDIHEKVGVESDRIKIIANQTYKATAAAYVIDGNVNIALHFWDQNAMLLTTATNTLNMPHECWVSIETIGTAPPNAVEVSIALYAEESSVTTGYFDEVTLNVNVRNSDFEEETSKDEIPGWIKSKEIKGISITNEFKKTQGNSLKIHVASSKDNSESLESKGIIVKESEVYNVSSAVLLKKGVTIFKLNFYDDSNMLLKSFSKTLDVPSKQWEILKVQGIAPEGAVKATICLIAEEKSTVYYDDIDFSGAIVNLGVVLTKIDAYSSAIGKDTQGNDVLYTGQYGNPAVFSIIDIRTLTVRYSFELPDTVIINNIRIAPDGNVYIATGGSGLIYKYDPKNNTIINLGRPLNELQVYDFQFGTNGEVYITTYKGCMLFKYDPSDPSKGFIKLLAPIVPNEMYALRMAIDNNSDKLYIGIGSHAHLIKYDISTNKAEKDILPPKYSGSTNVDEILLSKGKLIARITPSNEAVVIDTATDTLEYTIPKLDWYNIIETPFDNRIYYQVGRILWYYDIDTGTIESTDVNMGGGLVRGAKFLELNELDFPGYTLVGFTRDGKVVKYNPGTGKITVTAPKIPEPNVRIKSMKTGPDGKVYVGSYLAKGFATYDPKSGHIVTTKELDQVEAMGVLGNKIYFGCYPNAVMYEYDTSKPYLWGSNPSKMFDLVTGYDQDRPFAVLGVEKENELFIGTVPKYGKLQGALSIYNPLTGSLKVEKNIISNQSIISLAYKDGFIYGGSSIWGGLGINPSESDAKLFIWDIAKNTKVFETIPVPGQSAITSLLVGPDGNIWGFVGGWLFIFDPITREIIYRDKKFDVVYNGARWYDVYMEYNNNGYIYGVIDSDGKLFKLDPRTKEVTDILYKGDLDWLTQDFNGDLYFSKDQVYLYKYKK